MADKKVYRSASGKTIDMDAMRLRNERTLAVGNNPVNARGDEIGPGGEVIKTVAQAASEYYSANPKAVAKSQPVNSITEDRITEEERAPRTVSAAMSVDQQPAPQTSKSPVKTPAKQQTATTILDQTAQNADAVSQSALETKMAKTAEKAKAISEEKKAQEEAKLPKAATGGLDNLDL